MGDISLFCKSLSVICTTDLIPLLFMYVQCSVWKWLISAPLIFGPDLQPSNWQVLILPSSGACVCIMWVRRLDACLKCGLQFKKKFNKCNVKLSDTDSTVETTICTLKIIRFLLIKNLSTQISYGFPEISLNQIP